MPRPTVNAAAAAVAVDSRGSISLLPFLIHQRPFMSNSNKLRLTEMTQSIAHETSGNPREKTASA